MSFIEHERKTLACGTIVYSYMYSIGGYLINLRNIDTNEESGTAGVNVPKDYLLGIMDRLAENNITPDSAGAFIFNEVHKYFELYPPASKKAYSKYLYL